MRARITSYNVCYTKLLRPALKVAVVGHTDTTGAFTYNLDLSRRRAESMVNELIRAHGVITSYSIHYTKLYDRAFRRRSYRN